MMSGYVNFNREAILQIAIVGDNKQLRSVKAVIDTGFTGNLTLPKTILDELGFTLSGVQEVFLGDGSLRYFEVYEGRVIWHGQMRQVEINAAETNSLIGMGLLEGYKLEIEGTPNGKVTISPLIVSPSQNQN
jgi:clan AA aspartic protease